MSEDTGMRIGLEGGKRIMKRFFSELKYGAYLTVHPFKGFWDIKHEHAGSVGTAGFFLAVYTVLSVVGGYCTGYLFNAYEKNSFQASKQVFIVLALFFGYCISNWAFTCLFDGEGTFSDIFKATGYALIPLIISQILLIPLSNFFVLEEQAFYTTINSFAVVWMLFLILVSVLVTHNYSLGKGLLMILCIIFGMCVIAYIGLLFFNLIQQVLGFAATMITEFSARYL